MQGRNLIHKLVLVVIVLIIILVAMIRTNAIFTLRNWYIRTYKPYRSDKSINSAVRYGDVEFLQKLIDKGYDLDSTSVADAFFWWRMYSIRGDFNPGYTRQEYKERTYSLVKLLIEIDADVNKPGGLSGPMTPLEHALQQNLMKVAELLLECGANPDILIGYRERPLLYSVLGDRDWFELFLQYGADINIQDNEGNTVLHLAIANRRSSQSFKHLLETDFDFCIRNQRGQTPYDLAVELYEAESLRYEPGIKLNSAEYVKLFEKYGLTDKCKELIDVK